jgi:hypothetical protein
MENEVVEAKLQVRTELLDVLIWVVGNQPATMSDVLDGAGEALHLTRIVDACLLLG